VVKGSFNSLTSYEDLADVKAFFKDKDVRKFRLAVEQTFDSIQASADWLKRDQEDVSQVSPSAEETLSSSANVTVAQGEQVLVKASTRRDDSHQSVESSSNFDKQCKQYVIKVNAWASMIRQQQYK
jgi:hypothetical protein